MTQSTQSNSLSVSEVLKKRRSIKGFDPNHKMSDDEFRTLMEDIILSPTAFNIQHWRFVRVVSSEMRKSIRAAAWDQPQVTDASVLLVICMDLKAWEKEPARYWRAASQEVQDFVLPAMKQYYEGKEQVQRDEGMRSCGLAAMSIMLLAKEMGYDSCPMDGFDYKKVGQLINLPPEHAICMMLAIGKKIKEPWPRAGQLSLTEVLLTDSF